MQKRRNNFPVPDHQDYDAMVKLVETLEMLPTCDLATQPMIQFHYAFALNRYNRKNNWIQTGHGVPKAAFTAEHLSP